MRMRVADGTCGLFACRGQDNRGRRSARRLGRSINTAPPGSRRHLPLYSRLAAQAARATATLQDMPRSTWGSSSPARFGSDVDPPL